MLDMFFDYHAFSSKQDQEVATKRALDPANPLPLDELVRTPSLPEEGLQGPRRRPRPRPYPGTGEHHRALAQLTIPVMAARSAAGRSLQSAAAPRTEGSLWETVLGACGFRPEAQHRAQDGKSEHTLRTGSFRLGHGCRSPHWPDPPGKAESLGSTTAGASSRRRLTVLAPYRPTSSLRSQFEVQ